MQPQRRPLQQLLPPRDATTLLIQRLQAQQAIQHTAITDITAAVSQGADKVAALGGLIETQMRDLAALSANVSTLTAGQTTLSNSMTELNRKLDLLVAGTPPAAKRTGGERASAGVRRTAGRGARNALSSTQPAKRGKSSGSEQSCAPNAGHRRSRSRSDLSDGGTKGADKGAATTPA